MSASKWFSGKTAGGGSMGRRLGRGEGPVGRRLEGDQWEDDWGRVSGKGHVCLYYLHKNSTQYLLAIRNKNPILFIWIRGFYYVLEYFRTSSGSYSEYLCTPNSVPHFQCILVCRYWKIWHIVDVYLLVSFHDRVKAPGREKTREDLNRYKANCILISLQSYYWPRFMLDL